MTASLRHLGLGLALALAVALTGAGLAAAAGSADVPGTDARLGSQFLMHGRIVTAVRVRGERRGQTVLRHWTFAGLGCTAGVCAQLLLRRERSAHRYSRVLLTRIAPGRYAGSGRFYAALSCRGRRYPRGEIVPYRITVRVAQVVPIEGIAFASSLVAGYSNPSRIDRTPCPLGPSHDAASYTGAASPLPTPPLASFSVTATPGSDSDQFADTSAPGAGGAPVVARSWQFGDPASGSADTAATAQATHTFSAPGTYAVTLTVADANGLAATSTQTVVVPGPPAPGVAREPPGSSASLVKAQRGQHR